MMSEARRSRKKASSSPVLTIKRGVSNSSRWQDFIHREQNSVDNLIKDSFASFCKELQGNIPRTQAAGSHPSMAMIGSSRTISGYRVQPQKGGERFRSGSVGRRPKLVEADRSTAALDCSNVVTSYYPPRLPSIRTVPRNPARVKDFLAVSKTVEDSSKEPKVVPDGETRRFSTASQLLVPPEMAELEMMYAPMKNLFEPLPNAPRFTSTMPEPHPLDRLPSETEPVCIPDRARQREDDQESEICSVMADIPPLLAPIQSHALLEESLGHQIPPIPRTPARKADCNGGSFWGKTPPLPPRRTSSKLSLLRPNHLGLSLKTDCVYANAKSFINRSSLMSTGSSDGSSNGSCNPAEGPASPPLTGTSLAVTPSSSTGAANESDSFFPWSGLPSPSPASSNDGRCCNIISESFSQLEEPRDSSVASEISASSPASQSYVKMNGRIFSATGSGSVNGHTKESDYMSILYNAIQRQGGRGSVETAMSPYLNMMSRKETTRPSPDGIYERPASAAQSVKLLKSSKSGSKRAISRAYHEFKELMQEIDRKRQYRIGLNLFNTRPEMGIDYMVGNDFLELSPSSVAKFLHKRSSGLSKDKIGEYLGNLQSAFAMKVLSCFIEEFSFSGQRIDKSLRRLLAHVRVPGEAQKIERIMEEFSKRYVKCNPGFVAKLKSHDSVVTLAFAVMLLNTDLHTSNLKPEKKMSVTEFVENLNGVDGGKDFDHKLLKSIYRGIKKQEFVGGPDHVAQTKLIQRSIVQSSHKRPPLNLTEPHRRLVCMCLLYEVIDITATKRPAENGSDHNREIFLFNDLLVVTKQASKSRKSPTYVYRDSFHLRGLEVTLFHTPVYDYGIQISRKATDCILLTLNADSEHDRYKFVMDLQESIFEMDQMEQILTDMSFSQ